MSQSSKPLVPLTRGEIFFLIMLAMVQFTHIVDFMIIMPLGPQLMRIFEITPGQFGLLVSAYTFAAGASGFVTSFYVDRFDRRTTLLVAYIGFIVGTLACAIAPSYFFLMLARALAGAFGGVLGSIILSVVADAVASEKRGRAMGIVMASFSMASVFGVPFGVYLSSLFSWHAPFVFVGLVGALNLAMLFVKMPRMNEHVAEKGFHRRPREILGSIVKDRNQTLALTFTVVLMLSQFMLIPFLSPSMVANVGFTESQLAYIYFIGGGLTIFTSPIVGRLSDRFGRPIVFACGGLFVIIPNLIITNLGPTPIWMVLVVTSIFFVSGNARFVPAMAMVTSTVSPRARGAFMSINSCVQSFASGAAAMISGMIVERASDGRLLHYEVVGYLSIVLAIIAVVIGLRLKPLDET